MDILMIILRLLHVLAGVYWAGSTLLTLTHLAPGAKTLGQDGQKFMQQLTGPRKLSNWILATASLSLLSGLIMYFMQNWHLNRSPAGIVLTLGAVVGAGAYLHGVFVQRKALTNLAALGISIAASGGPPTSQQGAQMASLAAKVERNWPVLAYLLAFTIVLMATFQYF